MRLVNTETLQLEEFISHIPDYAILSHTWGDREVTFQDFQDTKGRKQKSGYSKIELSAKQARSDGFQYVWVDTCCIDKTSSAELSEAINSMMMWYERSKICYAYLADVPSTLDDALGVEAAFKSSRWFTRGWTLQELIAPPELVFFSQGWTRLFTRHEKATIISNITNIDRFFLLTPFGNLLRVENILRNALDSASVAQRMSWAATRVTTRTEDMAYCLLGIFGINMPLIYGEGDRAFFRLQEEIMKYTDDHSLFAWNPPPVDDAIPFEVAAPAPSPAHRRDKKSAGMLANSPAWFVNCTQIVRITGDKANQPFIMTNKGIRLDLPFGKSVHGPQVLLQCQDKSMPSHVLAVRLEKGLGSIYSRSSAALDLVEISTWRKWKPASIYVLAWGAAPSFDHAPFCTIMTRTIDKSLRIAEISSSEGTWRQGSRVIPEPYFNWKRSNIEVAVLLFGRDNEVFVLLLVFHGRTGEHACGLAELSGPAQQIEDTWRRIKLNSYRQDSLDPNRMVSSWWQTCGYRGTEIRTSTYTDHYDHVTDAYREFAYTASIELEQQFGKNLFYIDINFGPTVLDRVVNIDHEFLDIMNEWLQRFPRWSGRTARHKLRSNAPVTVVHYFLGGVLLFFNAFITYLAWGASVFVFLLVTLTAIYQDYNSLLRRIAQIRWSRYAFLEMDERRPQLLKYMLYYCIWFFTHLALPRMLYASAYIGVLVSGYVNFLLRRRRYHLFARFSIFIPVFVFSSLLSLLFSY